VKRTFLRVAVVVLLSMSALAQWQEKALWNFRGAPDGAYPFAGLVSDNLGNLYGTTMGGGNSPSDCYGVGCGTVFELSPNSNGTWSERVIYTFCLNYPNCTDGANPYGGLAFDRAGNLYGITGEGGNMQCYLLGCGVVFELSPSASGSWTYSTLYTFCSGANTECQDGALPRYVTLTIDEEGNVYGTTQDGGTAAFDYTGGVVFELSPGASGWTETVLHNFCSQGGMGYCPDGSYPFAGVTLDKLGNLYGTTVAGGPYQQNAEAANGVVYKLTPGSNGWTETVLYAFPRGGVKGSFPQASVTFDPLGDLYSTFTGEGNPPGPGGVFQLRPHGRFADVFLPGYAFGGVLIDPSRGALFGTVSGGFEGGNIFEITPPAQLTMIYTFCSQYQCADGSVPYGNLIKDGSGNLYGTTVYGGPYQQGTYGTNGVVFELTPSGGSAKPSFK
jgi:uncharacterized repeat protein (TIGR03803 family)